jgi:SHS2 domain-containing protein
MSYRYLDHITWADTAFEVKSDSLESLFIEAAEATLSVMIRSPDSLEARDTRLVDLSVTEAQTDSAIAQLLHEFLERILFFKDADQLLMRVEQVHVEQSGAQWHLRAHFVGERIDLEKQELLTDVKAVTHHQFEVHQEGQTWMATVVLDV